MKLFQVYKIGGNLTSTSGAHVYIRQHPNMKDYYEGIEIGKEGISFFRGNSSVRGGWFERVRDEGLVTEFSFNEIKKEYLHDMIIGVLERWGSLRNG